MTTPGSSHERLGSGRADRSRRADRHALQQAAAARPAQQQPFAPADAPPSRHATLTVVLPPGSDGHGVLPVAEGLDELDHHHVRILRPGAQESAPLPSALLRALRSLPEATVLDGVDDLALRAEVLRSSRVVIVGYGEDEAARTVADQYAWQAAASGCAVIGHDPTGRLDVARPWVAHVATDHTNLRRQVRLLVTNEHLAERTGVRASLHAHAAPLVGAAPRPVAAGSPRRPQVSAVVATVRPDRLPGVVRALQAQVGVDIELVVVGHGIDLDEAALRGATADGAVREITLRTAPPELTLGEVLNLGFEAASAPLIAKVDDDDLYGPRYLSEQALALDYAGAQIVGKWSWYVYLSSLDVTVQRRPGHEHVTQPQVSGATFLMTREAFAAVGFPPRERGEDIALLRGAEQQGLTVYATSRFNFVAVRHPPEHGHTWRADDLDVATRGRDDRVHFIGTATDQIFL